MREPDLQPALTHGERVRLIPVERLLDLRGELRELEAREALNGFQRWILAHKYTLEVPAAHARSIVLVAVPHPMFARVELAWQGRTVRCASLVMSDFETTERSLRALFDERGLLFVPVSDLPMKRLAARSGLAVYGRNNVCFVEGMGSQLSFAAYLTDVPCDDVSWAELRPAPLCARCEVCLNDCPTGAIREDRFLIDNERCLSYLNESADPFPGWLPASAHHCLYDCLRCQLRCPMNKPYARPGIGPIPFSEEETDMLLSGVPAEAYPPDLREKARLLGLDQWPAGLARNVRILIAQAEAGGGERWVRAVTSRGAPGSP